jgi:hypothetical protein
MSVREWKGRWWLPSSPGVTVGGDLRLADDEFALSLDGQLPYEAPSIPASGVITEFFKPVHERVILGESRAGEKFTLLDSDGLLSTIPGGTARVSDWRPAVALLGAHLELEDDLVFSAMECEFDYLLDWLGRARLDYSFTIEQETGRASEVNVRGERQLLGTSRLEGAGIELAVVPRWHVAGRRAEIELHASLSFQLDSALDWRGVFQRWVRPTRDLISFATLRPNQIERVRLRSHGKNDQWVEALLWLVDLDRPHREERTLIPQEMLFAAEEMPAGIEGGFGRWFELHAKHDSVFTLMLGVEYSPFIYDDQRFLAYAQAAEILHRVALGGAPLTKEEHRRRCEAVVASVADAGLREWAEVALKESNWYRLRDRLSELIQGLEPLGSEIVGDPDVFIRRVVQTRNYLTHRDKKPATVLDDVERYWHGQALAWLLRAWLLREFGFAQSDVDRVVRGSLRFGAFRRNFDAVASE